MTAVVWTCPSCRCNCESPFCAQCGEEPLAARDLTLRGLAEKALHAITSIDARVARTAWRLLRYPGRLTVDWATGIRRPYVAPFQLFLVANVLFFTLQWLTRETVFSSSLQSHMHQQDWSELARGLVDWRLDAEHMSLEQFAPVFDRAVVLNAKSLIFLMAGAFMLLLPVAFWRERRPFMTHVTFALHLYTFLLLLFCAALLAAKASSALGYGGLDAPRVDNVLSVANLVLCTLYLYLAIGPVYDARGLQRVATAFLLAIGVAAIVLGYRFVIFVITLYAT